jgi:monoamine oxidase
MMTVERGSGWYEGGGEWIDADHSRVLQVCREYGVPPEKSSQWPGLVVFQGEFSTENSVWLGAERDAELMHEEAIRLIELWRGRGTPDSDDQDDRPLGEWIDRVCSSKEGRWWTEAVTRSDEGEDTARIGLFGWLRGYAHYLNRQGGEMSLYRIGGGGGRLCERMAASLRDLRLGCAVTAIDSDSGEVWLATGEVYAFDRVVSAVPGSIFDRLISRLPSGLDQVEVHSRVQMSRAIKIVLEFDRPWWREKNWTGRMLCDLPCQQTWEIGRGGLHALGCYICGDDADWIRQRPDAVDVALRAIAEIHPEATSSFVGGAIHDWVGDSESGGAFPYYPVGMAPEKLEFVEGRTGWVGPWGRLHIAGDWACSWMGFIEGALESAERVVGEIGASE